MKERINTLEKIIKNEREKISETINSYAKLNIDIPYDHESIKRATKKVIDLKLEIIHLNRENKEENK
jgi:hypothetical protein